MNKYFQDGHCELCGKLAMEMFQIHKQIGGEFKRVCVCPKCLEQHNRELEMTRENFRRQFGDN